MYRAVILPVILCECEAWSVLLRGKHRLRVFKNGELGKMCGSGREVIEDWRKLHKEELTDLYSS
jgi:hypothetical protein